MMLKHHHLHKTRSMNTSAVLFSSCKKKVRIIKTRRKHSSYKESENLFNYRQTKILSHYLFFPSQTMAAWIMTSVMDDPLMTF